MKRKLKGRVPFGYAQTADGFLEEIPKELEAIDKIQHLVTKGTISLRDGATWVAYETGRNISHQGLKNVIRERYQT